MTVTPSMSLVLPTDHGSPDIWGAMLNTLLTLVDGHTHEPGLGALVPIAGLDFDSDLAALTHAITGLKAVDFTPVAASTVAALAGAFFVSSADNELYYRTTSGSNVQFTSGAALNVAAFVGGIGGDYSSVGALFSFDDATDSYWARQEVVAGLRAWAGLRVGNVDIYQQAASITNRVRLNSPAALAASYALTLPAALGGGTLALQVSNAGVMSLSNTFASAISAPDVKYTSDLTRTISGALWVDPNTTHTRLLSGSGAQIGYTLAASANPLTMELPVNVGDRITGYAVWCNKSTTGGATIAAKIWKQRVVTLGTESAASAGASNNVDSAGRVSVGEVGLAIDIAAGFQYYIVFTPSGSVTGGADQALSVDLVRTRP